MTLTYGFFNSLNQDRVYDAVQMGRIFDGVILDGVFGSIGDCFTVTEYNNMDLHIGTGRAWFNHTWSNNDSVINVTISASHPILPRYDTIVLEINSDPDVRANSIKVIPGTPASDPELPTLTNTETIHQYGLANVYIEEDTVVIDQGDIENLVGGLSCPFVTGPLSMISVEELIIQWQNEFDTWFQDLQNQLDENQAANLQNQIYNHDHSEELLTPVVGIATNAITSPTIAANAIDDTKIRYRVPILPKRQGASALHWDDAEGGLSNYTLTNVKMEVGVVPIIISNGNTESGIINVAFPTAFSYNPLAFLQGIANADYYLVITLVTVNGIKIKAVRPGTTGSLQVDVNWFAVGPE